VNFAITSYTTATLTTFYQCRRDRESQPKRLIENDEIIEKHTTQTWVRGRS